MADHVFSWPTPHVYPESRDLAGRHIGLVNPGGIRDTDGPLDSKWREAADEDRAALAARAAGEPDADAGAEGTDGDGTADSGTPARPDSPQPDRPRPVPAPPAVIPGT